MWNPIRTAPKDGTWILVCCNGFVPAVVKWYEEYGIFSESCDEGDVEDEIHDIWALTHWMPLPESPKE